jgi:carboxypeptidase C (cathepsin A)
MYRAMYRIALLITISLAGQAAATSDYGAEALKDEIHDLPGAPAVSFRTFSGYIDVSAPTEKEGSRRMFYWFAESQDAPKTDPVLLWTNGGPGCTGLGGFLSEMGPFRVGKDGKDLAINEFSWTKLANMVFIEQPVGVGFSTASTHIDYGDEQAATDNHRFVVGFFKRFPQYAKQDFYIASESYGGHYMPTLAAKIKQHGDVPQFRGIFLGNPLTYMQYRNYGQYGTAWGHQLLPAPLWKRYEASSCATTFPPSAACSNITDEMDTILAGFDPYALDFDKCLDSHSTGRKERWMLRKMILRANSVHNGGKHQLEAMPPYQPCIEEFMTAYLNRPDVQAAIHVKPGTIKWSMCSDAVGSAYNITDVNSPTMSVWKDLIKFGDLNMLILSGDDDTICATLGTQQFIWDLGYPSKDGKTWAPWKVNGQVAGFHTEFEVPSKGNLGAFAFATVHSAGHMVPATQPEKSLALLKIFLGKGDEKKNALLV